MSHVASTTNRGTGKTTRMIREMPADTRFIVVHTRAMADHIERLLWEHRPELIHNSVRRPHVMVVQSTHDVDRMRGCPFAVDHVVWDFEGMPREALDLLRALQRPRPRT